MKFRQLGEFISFKSRVKVIDRFSGNVLYDGFAPGYRKLQELSFADFSVYLFTSEIIDDCSVVVVVVDVCVS